MCANFVVDHDAYIKPNVFCLIFVEANIGADKCLGDKALNRRNQPYDDDSDYEIDDIYSRKQLVKTKRKGTISNLR